jgi:predicted PurR-regulated permease PerM
LNTYPEIVPVPRRRLNAFEAIATFAITATLLYLGAGIFVPLVLAILLAFALNPLVSWMNRRLHLPDPVAVILAVLIAVAALAGFAVMAGLQIANLVQELPGYRSIMQTKIEGLQEQFGGMTWLDQITGMMSSLGDGFNGDSTGAPAEPGQMRPIPVTISNDIGPLAVITSVMGSIVGPIATAAIVTVFLIFLLMGRADMQERFIRLVSAGRYSLTNLAISDASRRVGRYLIIQLMVNTTYGIIFGIGLWLIGVPSAPLWGLLIILFRYIPFVGALIIAIVPFTLTFAVDPGWNMLLMAVGLFVVIDLTTANVIEPRLYGSSTGVSPIAILLSAMFWATLWGPVGLILATPMTVVLVVVGRHLPQFQFLETLLGSEPVLSTHERLYQRMLNGKTEDAIDLSEDYLEEHDREKWVDDVMLPALRMATAELPDRPESVPQRRQLIATFEAVLNNVVEPVWQDEAPIMLIGGRTEIDEAAARLLGMKLLDDKLGVSVLPPGAIRQEAIGRLELEPVHTVVLMFMGADIRAQCRYVARRIRRMDPEVRIAVVLLNAAAGEETADLLHVDALYRDLDKAADAIKAAQAPVKNRQAIKAQPFAGLGRGDDALGNALDAIADEFDVPVALINLTDDERHLEDEDAAELTRMAVEKGDVLVIHNSQSDSIDGDNAYLVTNGIDFFAAAPLVLADGSVVGVLALQDYEQHEFSEADIARLKAKADELVVKFG